MGRAQVFSGMKWTLLHAVALLALAGTAGPQPDASSQPNVITYDVGKQPRSIAVADFNGDEHPDVVVANSGDGTLTLFLGGSGGVLRQPPLTIPAGNEPADVDAADLDNDNDNDFDIVVANHETSLVTVLINDGQADFSPAIGSPFDSGARPHLHGLATGDFDGDGRTDVAVESADSREVRVFLGTQHGFGEAVPISVGTMPCYRLGVGDVTGDGRPDVLVPGHGDNTVRVIHRKGTTLAAAEWTVRVSAKPWMVVADDVNGDERNDLVVVVSDGVDVWLNTTQGFSPAPGSPFAVRGATEVATGDFDGDGVADIAIGPWDGSDVTILTGLTFRVHTVRTCHRSVGLALADLDGDGSAELIAACATENRIMVLTYGQ